MLIRTLLLASGIAACAVVARGAWAQADLRPAPNPRLPPQPGQGLPLEDRQFLRDALALSTAEAEAAAQATGRGGEEGTRRVATTLAERHRRLAEELRGLMTARGLRPDEPISQAEAPSNQRVAEALRHLQALRATPGSERDFLAAQVEIHPVLVEMYQTEASQSVDRELGRFAIVNLVGIQEDFAALVPLAERHGVPRPGGLLSNPPQYGPGAGPPR